MNLNALFQQIQFTEKQAREKRNFIQQGCPHGCHPEGPSPSHMGVLRGLVPGKAWQSQHGWFLPPARFCKDVTTEDLQTEHILLQVFVVLQLNVT